MQPAVILHEVIRIREIGARLFGSPDRAMIWAAIAEGKYNDRLVDVTAVAVATGCSRQTVLRHVQVLVAEGLVETRKEGRHTWLIKRHTGRGRTSRFLSEVRIAARRIVGSERRSKSVQTGHKRRRTD
jgi:DNA-binding GntR family transcriptional regulator